MEDTCKTFSWVGFYTEMVVREIGDKVQLHYHANGISSKDLFFSLSLSLSSTTFYKYLYEFKKYITRDSGLWNLTKEGVKLYEIMRIEQKANKVQKLLNCFTYSQLANNKVLYDKQIKIVADLEAQLDAARKELHKLEGITFPIN